jgi:Cof subfamily protein (haloacid dehalogenase superfamily)
LYRLAFCDLDGTLLKHDQTVNPAVSEAMQAVIAAGKMVTICSGRSYQQFSQWLDMLPVNVPVVTCNGGVIVEPRTRRLLLEQTIPLDVARETARFSAENSINLVIALDDVHTVLAYRSAEREFVLLRDGETVSVVPDPVAVLVRPIHKAIIMPGEARATERAIHMLQKRLGIRSRVVASSDRWAEIIAPGVSKAKGMEWLCQHLGVRQEETLALGDADNDVEMLEWAGCGVAMGNALPAARAAADWVAPSVEDDGAAVALRRFMLNGCSV